MEFFHARVEPVIEAWRQRRTGAALTLLRQWGLAAEHRETKGHVRASLNDLATTCESGTIGDVIQLLRDRRIIQLTDEISLDLDPESSVSEPSGDTKDERAIRERDFSQRFVQLPYRQISAFCTFLDESTPFSTKHGVKGAEFDTVIVVLDDKGARWTLYSFEKYLSGEDRDANPDRYRKTRNLFYVCCSRAKRNLAVVDFGPAGKTKEHNIRHMFGESNCYELE